MNFFKRRKVINEGKNILNKERIAFKQVNFNYQTNSDFNLRHLEFKHSGESLGIFGSTDQANQQWLIY